MTITVPVAPAPAMNGIADTGDLPARLRDRLATLTTERQGFLVQAQRTLAAYDAAIGELTALLAPPAERTPPDTDDDR